MVKDHFHELHLLDVSEVTTMHRLFDGEKRKIIGIDNWDLSNVTDMSYMFDYTIEISDISNWNVSKVTDMCGMFSHCGMFNQNLNLWNVSNVTDMAYMFFKCKNFNSDISY